MPDRARVLKGLDFCREMGWASCHTCPYYCGDVGTCTPKLKSDAIALLKAQEQIINDLYTRYDDLCKGIREKYESDDVCGLCQYDGAYVGQSGDWVNECPGFETNECFCMNNNIRRMCGQPLIEEP